MIPLAEAVAQPAQPALVAAYLGVTMVIPVLIVALATLVCGFIFMVAAAFGLGTGGRWVYGLTTALLASGALGVLRWARLRRRRRRGVPPLISLEEVARLDIGVEDVGHKAWMLAQLGGARARVPQSWVLTPSAFQQFAEANRLDPHASEDMAAAVRAGKVPRRLLKRLYRTLISIPSSQAILRSSFVDEDTADRAFPGVYESIAWKREQGLEGLGEAMKEVWASYWSPDAQAYRAEATRNEPTEQEAPLASGEATHDETAPQNATPASGEAQRNPNAEATHAGTAPREAPPASGGAARSEPQASEVQRNAARSEPTASEVQNKACPPLPILVCSLVPHELAGFASSVDVATGYRERHLVEVSEGTPWTGFHDVLTGRMHSLTEAVAGAPDGGIPAPTREASRLVSLAEALRGCPMEVEWGYRDELLWAYQARPLTALPDVSSLTNSYAVELPRYPLTPLSRSFLFGDGPPSRAYSKPLTRLGMEPLGDEALTFYHGAPWLRVEACKPLLTAQIAMSPSPRALLGMLGTLLRVVVRPPRPRLPEVPAPSAPDTKAPELLAQLRKLRDEDLQGLIARQMAVLQMAAMADAATESVFGAGQAPRPVVSDLEAGRPWYACDQEAELMAARALDEAASGDAAPPPVSDEPSDAASASGAASPGAAAAEKRRRPLGSGLLLRARDGLLQERERLKTGICVTNFRARRLAQTLSTCIGATWERWQPDDVYYLSLEELEKLAVGGLGHATAVERIRTARAEYASWQAESLPPLLHFDAAGEPIHEPPPRDGCGLLSSGIPLGNGQAEGTVTLIHHGDAIDRAAATGRVVILPDAALHWAPLVHVASAVVMASGGPLSHIAILCRERGIPAVVGAGRISESVQTGDRVLVDGERGEVRVGL